MTAPHPTHDGGAASASTAATAPSRVDAAAFARLAAEIAEAGRRMDRFGWTPSYGGNLSALVDADTIAITRSGRRKGALAAADIMAVDRAGRALAAADRPSAETRLHCQIYDLVPEARAVMHGHSVPATVLSRLVAGDAVVLGGYEMIKAFEGQTTHDATLRIPVIDNHQDMEPLRARLAPLIRAGAPGYVLRGHGAYAWGRTVAHAVANLEGLEFLLACELETRKATGRG